MLETAAALVFGVVLGALAMAGWARRRRRRLEDELAEGRRRLAAARKARDTFFDLTTHELRSPLSGILGYQELLEDEAYGPMPEKARDPVVRIGRSARYLLNLIDGAIEVSRIRTGAVRLDLEPVDMGALCSSVADSFITEAAERGLSPHVEMPPRLPTIRSDPDRLVRALDLAIMSAVRHPAGDSLSFEVSARGRDVTVTLAPVDIAFDPLAGPPHADDPAASHGPDPATDDPTRRLGIRLEVAARIAELLGGRLDLPTRDGSVREIVFRLRDASSASGL